MADQPNILFIMCDQLRWDYLSCTGHPALKTPNIDALARRGVSFDRAYVQSPVCGPSRMSTYTGRTVFSHGASWNGVPLPVGEWTIGDYLSPDYRVAVAGKTHVRADVEGMHRLGLTRDTEIGLFVSQGGFEPFDRDDGIHTAQLIERRGETTYNGWLRSKGYPGENPWHDFANSVETGSGEVISGWELKSAPYPARVSKEHSETAYITDRAIEFIDEGHDRPWLLHLSYIKPHWPYVAPAPYHAIYGVEDMLPVVRSDVERAAAHPVFDAFLKMRASVTFSDDRVRQTVVPTYMGLVKQIDDEIGRLMAHLESRGIAENTVIVFTSDHGDYLGDHWMGEKELFHEASVRVPLIIMDPRPAAEATRGERVADLVESIDLAPTFLALAGRMADDQRMEGRSLLGYLDGKTKAEPREAVFSELDYSFYAARRTLGLGSNDARAFMVRTERWKYIDYLGFGPQLFDLHEDPDEFNDLGQSVDHGAILLQLRAMLVDRLTRRRYRVTESDRSVEKRTANEEAVGVRIGEW
jgi:arylsulfatase A-like enzyme